MFFKNSKIFDRYFHFFYKLFKFENKVKLYAIDFQKSWLDIIWRQKWLWALEVFSEIIQQVYLSLTPVILSYIYLNKSYQYLFAFVAGYIALEVLNRVVLLTHTKSVTQAMNSIEYQAYKYFLTVDPIFHSTKSTGKIVGKIQGGVSDLSFLLNGLVFNILPAITGYFTVSIILWNSDWRLGVIGFVAFWVITIVNAVLSFFQSRAFKKRVSKSSDKTKAITVENLTQNTIVRSTFAVKEQLEKTEGYILQNMSLTLTSDNTGSLATAFTRIVYISSVFFTGLIALNLVNAGQLDQQLAVVLMVTFVNGSSGILRLGNMVRMVTDTYIRVNDLWEYIRNFGKQTYPVLPEDKPV